MTFPVLRCMRGGHHPAAANVAAMPRVVAMDKLVMYALTALVLVLGTTCVTDVSVSGQCTGDTGAVFRQTNFTSAIRVILVVEDSTGYRAVQPWLLGMMSSVEEKLLSLGIGVDANLPNMYALHSYNSNTDPGGEYIRDHRGEVFFPVQFLGRALSRLNVTGSGPADATWHGYDGLLRAFTEHSWQVPSSVATTMLLVSTDTWPGLKGPQSSLFMAGQLSLPGWSVTVISNTSYQCSNASSKVIARSASGVAYSLDGTQCVGTAPTPSPLHRRGDGQYAANPDEVAFLQKQIAWSLPTPATREQFSAVFADVMADSLNALVSECRTVSCSCTAGQETCASLSSLNQCKCAAKGYYWDEWVSRCSRCRLSQWSEWTQCSRTCGHVGGVTMRTRTVVGRADNSGDAACPTLAHRRNCAKPAITVCPPDECQLRTHTCDAMATCNNTDDARGYVCTCLDGYRGDGLRCEEVDECLSSPCRNGGSCTDDIASYACHCTRLYTGADCSQPLATLVPLSEASIIGDGRALSRLQLMSNEGALSAVCAGGFTPEAAAVACRHMGFVEADQMGTLTSQTGRPGHVPVVMVTSNECHGNETDLRDCLEVRPVVARATGELAYRCLTVGLACRATLTQAAPSTPGKYPAPTTPGKYPAPSTPGNLVGTVVTDANNGTVGTVTATPLRFSQLITIAVVAGLVLLCALFACCLLAHLRHKSYIGTTAHTQLARASLKELDDDITSPPKALPARRGSKYNYSDLPPDMSHRMSHHISVIVDSPVGTPSLNADSADESSPPESPAATPPYLGSPESPPATPLYLGSALEVGSPALEDIFGDLRQKYSLPRAVVAE